MIDFDHARPAPPTFDVAYGLEYSAPFRPDDVAMSEMHHLTPPDRGVRIATLYEGYGSAVPVDVVDLVASQQRATRDTCALVGARGIEPQATWIADGYLDELAERIRWTESFRYP